MPLIVVGSCNNCGVCCLSKSLGGAMLENPCIERGEDRCKFYTELDNGRRFGHCLIIGRVGNIQDVRDRFGVKITAEQIKWFDENCLQFPTADISALPIGCSYKIVQVD